MKKVLIFAALALFFTLASCTSQDDKSPSISVLDSIGNADGVLLESAHAFAVPEIKTFDEYRKIQQRLFQDYQAFKAKAYAEYEEKDRAAFREYLVKEESALKIVKTNHPEKYAEWFDAREKGDLMRILEIESMPEFSPYLSVLAKDFKAYLGVESVLYDEYIKKEDVAYEAYMIMDVLAYGVYERTAL